MIKNPIHLRLEKFSEWQHRTFMVCLCERMYPNYALFCQQTDFANPAQYRKVLDLVWESLIVKGAKINFDSQLEKFEDLIPAVSDFDVYSVYPAIDACQALSELMHAYLSGESAEHAIAVSEISLNTVAGYEMTQAEREMTDEELKILPAIIDELDIQWEIFRLLKEEEERNIELIKGLKEDLREANISNIGVFLSN
ncbi:YjaG family protein [Zophobihabitans entericus]|uniref:DUF416 family protein n=1 Tax=Zophobihabitans entericus TaxID=1635327 RepID=A0A6G9I7W0_9GAMM|nr:DUF416 family protein [Zophobihabitans entericus]QIQ20295.1 DUF416 family protein [Zophobihabitans entericus]